MQTLSANKMDHLRVAEDGAIGTPRPTIRARILNVWAFLRQRPEIIFLGALILIFNAPIFFGKVWQSMVFQPDAVRSGQWWRLVTHPFVHLTWYHLLLDGTAFLSLYCSLVERRIFVKLAYVAAAGAGSLVTSWIATPAISTNGLCGLSGIAHGLMAISAIEMLGGDQAERRIGWITLVLVLGKAGFEAITGRMFFGFLNFGLLGTPVAVSHAGGILSALIAMLLLRCVEQALICPCKIHVYQCSSMVKP